MTIHDFQRRYEETLNDCGWILYLDEPGQCIEITTTNSYGEDVFYVFNNTELDDMPERLRLIADDIDIDEYVIRWLEAKHNGIQGVPGVQALVKAGEENKASLYGLSEALSKVSVETD